MFYNLKEKDLDKYIYRIISLERLEELFATKHNVLVKPSKWEDLFENFILKSKVRLLSGEIREYNFYDRFYGQCWTLHSASDAVWRIYSPNGDKVRIRTTVRKLLGSLYEVHPSLPEVRCCLGKVLYLGQKRLMDYANNTFDDSGIAVENLFRSLLVKRRAFLHEKEVRLLYDEIDDKGFEKDTYSYVIEPNSLISQIMIDPRRSESEAKSIKARIRKATGYKGVIKRSLMYTLPKQMVVNVTNA